MDPEIINQVQPLFQEAYSAIYVDGAFDSMADQVEAAGDSVMPISQLVSKIIDSTVKDAGVTDLNVLFALAVLLIADLLESLEKVGITSEGVPFDEIINSTMQMVLSTNPDIAALIQQDPAIQEMMSKVGGQETPATDVAPQGVLSGGPIEGEV